MIVGRVVVEEGRKSVLLSIHHENLGGVVAMTPDHARELAQALLDTAAKAGATPAVSEMPKDVFG